MTTDTTTTDPTATTWTAAFRSAVVSPYETIDLFETRRFSAQTLRQIIRLDGGGDALRIRLSNRYGTQPLHIGGAHLARRTRGSGIDPRDDTTLRVDGAEDFTVPAGEDIITDTVHQPTAAGDEWAVTLWLPDDTGPATYSAVPLRTGYAVPGNALTAPTLDGTENLEELATRHFISGADVLAPTGTPVAVAFGDSWFEGAGTTNDTDNRFPDLLNDRLRAAGHTGWTVNTGLSANRLLTDEIGEHALARLQRDALEIPRHIPPVRSTQPLHEVRRKSRPLRLRVQRVRTQQREITLLLELPQHRNPVIELVVPERRRVITDRVHRLRHRMHRTVLRGDRIDLRVVIRELRALNRVTRVDEQGVVPPLLLADLVHQRRYLRQAHIIVVLVVELPVREVIPVEDIAVQVSGAEDSEGVPLLPSPPTTAAVRLGGRRRHRPTRDGQAHAGRGRRAQELPAVQRHAQYSSVGQQNEHW
ncbi:hypothetical protein SALBM135S_08197 [Streptomyces alboniger]